MFLLLLHRGAPNREGEPLPRQLLRFCQEIADGMQYLSKKGFIHRDLAARNILLTADTKCKVKGYSGLSIYTLYILSCQWVDYTNVVSYCSLFVDC